MPPNRALPSLLSPYLFPPEFALCLITSVLGASSNWLTERYVVAGLTGDGDGGGERDGQTQNARGIHDDGEGAGKVVLVSFMREVGAWREGVRRGGAIDLAKLAERGRFAFVDGLSLLFASPHGQEVPPSLPADARLEPRASIQKIPIRGSPTTGRTAPAIATEEEHKTSPARFSLTSPSAPDIEAVILSAINSLNLNPSSDSPRRDTTLILDAPDLLAATASSPIPALLSLITNLALHPSVRATVVTAYADAPLLAAAAAAEQRDASGQGLGFRFSDLEAGHAALVASLAHRARWVMQLRGLETGKARDVSGVLGIARGGGWEGDGEEGGEREVLYFVKGDGSVGVFERGGDGG